MTRLGCRHSSLHPHLCARFGLIEYDGDLLEWQYIHLCADKRGSVRLVDALVSKSTTFDHVALARTRPSPDVFNVINHPLSCSLSLSSLAPSLSLRDCELISDSGPSLELTAWINHLRYGLSLSPRISHIAHRYRIAPRWYPGASTAPSQTSSHRVQPTTFFGGDGVGAQKLREVRRRNS